MNDNTQELKNPKKAALDMIGRLERKLVEYEQAYESLRCFKRTLQASENQIQSANAGKVRSMQTLESVRAVSRTASRYMSGTDALLNGVGSRLVGVAINALQVAVDMKLSFYRTQIRNCETQIMVQKRTVAVVSESIDRIANAVESMNY